MCQGCLWEAPEFMERRGVSDELLWFLLKNY